ncbi:DUF4097 family beta strand repeat-containing protein [Cesiribacter andamanensis]|uniref:DUF4097 domain-containing protein n=1 Tax=Cesiribacter andamanensis AMV16 TaxID=1279009 RepID=M7NVB6_9BACT|nr:DUF4097 family beta strand repeat-containing protein [Cesiribacter andamanensis]EMR02404.1 hypothetical protein ADICEAN_02447 [Cesiribacter andamanensis AMV16]
MKKISFFSLLLMLSCLAAQAQQTISERLNLPQNSSQYTIKVMNLHGKVEVRGHGSTAVELQAKKTVEARKDADAGELERDWSLAFRQEGNTILVYADGPGVEVKQNSNGSWSYNMHDRDKRTKDRGTVTFDIVLRVPDQAVVNASTVNGGDVLIQDLRGDASGSNVNGSVRLTNIGGNVSAATVNGDVEVQSKSVPKTDTNFTTVNGTIRLTFPTQLAANIQYTSVSGDFYTDFAVTTAPLKEEGKRNGGTYYKIGGKSALQVGQGGPKIKVTTVNGDMYLKKGN